MIRPAGQRLRAAVLCVCDANRPDAVVGTAFAIAPGWVLTCAHVAAELAGRPIRLDDRAGLVLLPGAPVLPPDPTRLDLALLPVTVPDALILPCHAGPASGGGLVARGYAPVAGADGPGGRELRFAPRGQVRTGYGVRTLDDAYELAGDMAEGGFSGAPLLDVATGAVVGAISGGLASRGRSWAVPLAGAGWDVLTAALAWNDAHLPRYGPAVNAAGARMAAGLQAARAIGRQADRRRFQPARHVHRPDLPAQVAAFMAGDRPAMAVVGGANTGKTWHLCMLASDATAPTLLLATDDLPRGAPPDPAGFFAAALHSTWPAGPDLPGPPTPEAMAAAAAAEGTRLLVLLDAVNEAMDVRGFANGWLAEAVGWAAATGARLLFTTRPEPWPLLARTLPGERLHAPGIDSKVPEARITRLGDFSEEEATAALAAYDLSPALSHMLGRLPLMFRLAADQGGTGAEFGLVRMVDAYVATRLDEAVIALERPNTTLLRARVRRLAAAAVAVANGSLALPIDAARDLAGSDEVLEALLACGLLTEAGAAGEAVRFTYDQVAEATAPPDPGASFAALSGTLGLRRAASSLLRLEADDDETGFATALAALHARLAVAAAPVLPPDAPTTVPTRSASVGRAAVHAARFLPPARHAQADAIYAALARLAPSMALDNSFEALVRWLAEAPLPPERRAALLLEVAPGADRLDFRRKEWEIDRQDPRPAFGRLVQQGDNVAGALGDLLDAHPDDVRPVLLHALDDGRMVDGGQPGAGEDTVGSLVAGVLLHRGRSRPIPLILALLARSGDTAGVLLAELVASNGAEVLAHAVEALDGPDPLPALLVLRRAGAKVGGPLRAAAVAVLGRMLGPGPTGLEAATVLRPLDPGHLAAWDRLAAEPAVGGWHLTPVPAERFDAALALVGRPGGLAWMAAHDGPETEQSRMVAALAPVLAPGRPGIDLGHLVERKLGGLVRGGVHLRPWAGLAQAVAPLGDESCRRCLIRAAFDGDERMPEMVTLADVLVSGTRGGEEARLMAGELLAMARRTGAPFLPLWLQLRAAYPLQADNAAMQGPGDGAPAARQVQEAVFAHWTAPRVRQTRLSRAVVALVRAGTPVAEAVSAKTYHRLVDERLGLD